MATTTQSIGGDVLGLETPLVIQANLTTAVVNITASDPNAAEPSDTGAFTITRTGGDLSQDLQILYFLSGSASAGTDYERLPNPIVIPAGATSVEVLVRPINDSGLEGNESIELFLRSGTGYTVGSSARATVTIADNDPEPLPVPTVNITPSTLTVEEGESGGFTITRTGNTADALQVTINLSADAALTSEDFALTGNILSATATQIQVVIPEGQASTELTFAAESDVLAEAVESLSLTVVDTAAYDVGTSGSATASIAESAAILPTISLTPDALLVEEGETDSLTVTRTGDTSDDLFVTININPGSGLTASDFSLGGNVLALTETSLRVTIPAGQASTGLTFTAENDALAEAEETLTFTVVDTDTYNVDAGAGSATASIAPSDPVPLTGSITIIHETDVADGTDFSFDWDLGAFILDDANPDDGDSITNQTVLDDLAAGLYTIKANPVTGFQLFKIELTSNTDDLDGDSGSITSGTVEINLTPGEDVTVIFTSVQISPPEDIDYAIAPTTSQLEEGDVGETPITFTLTRSGTTTGESSVEFVLVGDALLGEDYSFDPITGVTGTGVTVTEDAGVFTVTFAPNATEATLTLNVMGDTAIEADETIRVQLQNGTAPNGSATISTPEAVTTLLNDDELLPPDQDIDYAITTDTTGLSEGDSGRQVISFTITREGATDVASQVALALGGNAELNTDYEFVSVTGATLTGDVLNPTLAFEAGATTATVTFAVLGDTVVEPDETIVATLSDATAPDNATISIPSATTTILNDDEDEPSLPNAGPLLDLSKEVGSVSVEFQITREAAFTNVIQFYEIDDNQGTVAGLAPGDAGYKEAALSRIVTGVELTGINNTTTSRSVVLEGGKFYAPILFPNGDRRNPLFAFNEANPGDRVQILSPEANVFRFEDLVGGDDDFNDLIVEATILSNDIPEPATDLSSLVETTALVLDSIDFDGLPDSVFEAFDFILDDVSDFLFDTFGFDLNTWPELDELTGLVAVGVDLIQDALADSGFDATFYFYATDELGLVDNYSPFDAQYEEAVRNNFISDITLSELFNQPLSSAIELPGEPYYSVAVELSTEPDNLYTVQDVLALTFSIPGVNS